jgi:hypothetical protein
VNVALSLPAVTPQAGELSLEARGNVRGFQRAGHDVTLYYESDLPQLAAETDEYDLVVLTSLDKTIETDETHLHHQIGGFGSQDLDPRLVANTFQKADTVSVVDPALPEKAPWFELLDVTTDDVAMVPSPPDPDLFPARSREHSDGTALVPNLGTEYAPDRRCARIVRHTPTVTYRAHAREADYSLPGNVNRHPPVPVSATPRTYGRAELVFDPAGAEALSTPCYRALCASRAYVSANEAIGALQTLPADVVDTGNFGASVAWWQDTYRVSFFEGDHYFSTNTEGLPEVLSTVMDDPELRWTVAERGREWVETAFDDWGWQEKAETVVELVREHD